jgi:copper chaperone
LHAYTPYGYKVGMIGTYTVSGMTCGHCASSVREEIGRLDGVRSVEVDVQSGRVTVTSDRPLAEDEVRGAVTEAGYQLVG